MLQIETLCFEGLVCLDLQHLRADLVDNCYRLRCLAEAFADKMESPRNSLLPILDCLVTIERLLRRADREAEGARLLSEYAPKGHLGFESPALRQYELKEGSRLGPFLLRRKEAGDSNPRGHGR